MEVLKNVKNWLVLLSTFVFSLSIFAFVGCDSKQEPVVSVNVVDREGNNAYNTYGSIWFDFNGTKVKVNKEGNLADSFVIVDEVLILVAQPNNGYAFVEWSDGVKTASREISTLKDATFVAVFDIAKTITVENSNTYGGTVLGAGDYAINTTATLEAVPRDGYYFDSWSDGLKVAKRFVYVQDNMTLAAVFKKGSCLNYGNTRITTNNGKISVVEDLGQVIISPQSSDKYTYGYWTLEGQSGVYSTDRTIAIDFDDIKSEELNFVLNNALVGLAVVAADNTTPQFTTFLQIDEFLKTTGNTYRAGYTYRDEDAQSGWRVKNLFVGATMTVNGRLENQRFTNNIYSNSESYKHIVYVIYKMPNDDTMYVKQVKQTEVGTILTVEKFTWGNATLTLDLTSNDF